MAGDGFAVHTQENGCKKFNTPTEWGERKKKQEATEMWAHSTKHAKMVLLFQWLVSMRHYSVDSRPISLTSLSPRHQLSLHRTIRLCVAFFSYCLHSSRSVPYLGCWTCHVCLHFGCAWRFRCAIAPPTLGKCTQKTTCIHKIVMNSGTQKKERDELLNERLKRGLFVALCFLCIGCISHRIVLDATFALFIYVETRFCSSHLVPTLSYIRRDLMFECSMFYLLMLWFTSGSPLFGIIFSAFFFVVLFYFQEECIWATFDRFYIHALVIETQKKYWTEFGDFLSFSPISVNVSFACAQHCLHKINCVFTFISTELRFDTLFGSQPTLNTLTIAAAFSVIHLNNWRMIKCELIAAHTLPTVSKWLGCVSNRTVCSCVRIS